MVIPGFNYTTKKLDWFKNNHPIYNALIKAFDRIPTNEIESAFNQAHLMLLNIQKGNRPSDHEMQSIQFESDEVKKRYNTTIWSISIILARYIIRNSQDGDNYYIFISSCPYLEPLFTLADNFEKNCFLEKDCIKPLIIELEKPLHPSFYSAQDWCDFTNGFSSLVVDFIIASYSSKEEKIYAIDSMEKSWGKYKKNEIYNTQRDFIWGFGIPF